MPPRRPPPLRRRHVDRDTDRAGLVVEPLEDRSQPSASALDALPLPAPPVGIAALVRTANDFAPAPVRHELVLIDRDVPDRDALVRNLLATRAPGTAVEVVELTGGGVAEVTAVLARYRGLDAVHVLSHAGAGALRLGGDVLDDAALDRFATSLRGWGGALSAGADLLLYGCDLAGDPAGRALASRLAELTGADVAASTDLTGAAVLGGDWDLEHRTGVVETATLVAGGWTYTLSGSLLFSTVATVSNTGTPGLDSWQKGEVISFGDPNFTLAPGVTGGTFSSVFDLATFGDGDVKVDAIHYVSRQVTVGTGANAITLLPGDVLLSASDTEVLTSLNSLQVIKDEVFVFRPAAPGNYSSGTFLMLLDDFRSLYGGADTRDITLVEADTVVGDATLAAGSILFARDGGAEDNDVFLLVPSGAGTGATTGTVSVLIEGDDLGIGKKVFGLELVQSPLALGDEALAAGTLLVALDASATVGSNAVAVTKFDVFTLSLTSTTLGTGTASATAAMLFRGADVGLGSSGEALDAVAIRDAGAGNSAPTAGPDSYTAFEDTPLTVSAAGGVLANDADADGDPLTAALASGPTNGTVALNPDGGFTYTPAANYNGPDSFTYTVSDGRGGTATGTVNVAVRAVNDAPTFALGGNPPTVDEDSGAQTVAGFAGGISPGPADEGGQTLAFVATGNTNPALFSAGPVVAPDGTLTYTPAPDASGTATIALVLRDDGGTATGGQDTSAARTFTITVRSVDDPPTLNAIGDVTVPEDAGPQPVSLTGITAGGGESQALQVTAASSDPGLIPNPTVSYTTPSATGTLTFAPAPDASGTATITVTVRDAGANGFLGDADDATTTRQFTVTVTAVPDPPVANPDTYSTSGLPFTVLLSGGVLTNDTDADGGTLTAAVASFPTNGVLIPLPDGSFTYTPNLGFSGVDTFTYQAVDSTGLMSAPATVTINVALGNRAPTATNDSFTTNEDAALSGSVLANDTDADGDSLAVAPAGGPSNGTLVPNPDGTFTYTPNANFSGTDSFAYTISDGNGGTSGATVMLTVVAVNDAPAALNDSATAAEDGSVTIGVRANDTDAENDALTVVAVTQPANGTVTTDGLAVTYTPNANFSGTDSFTYTISDGNGGTATATVNVTVNAVNDAPTLDPIADVVVAEDGGSRSVSLTGITAGGGEVQTLTVTATSSDPALIPNPTVSYTSPNATGTLTFTPAANASGTVTITVTVSDGVTTTSRTFNVTVTAVNDAPTITPIADQTIPEDGTVGPLAFTVGDAETPADALTVTATSSNPALIPDANIAIVSTGGGGRQITLTPVANNSGAAVITLTVSDGTAGTTTTFTATVQAVNDTPVAANDNYATPRNTTLSVPPAGTLINDTDADGDVLTAAVVSGPQNGTLQLNPDGSFVYDPTPGYVGTDSFTYAAVDSSGAMSGTATVVIRVGPPPPVAANDFYTAAGSLQVNRSAGVLANDTAPVGVALSASLVSGPSRGVVFLGNSGGFLYVPQFGFTGTDSFTYRATDPFGRSTTPATVTINVVSPRTAEEAYTVVQDQVLAVPAPGELEFGFTATLLTATTDGTVSLAADGSFTYTPAPGYTGTDSFTYQLSDGSVRMVFTVRITVVPAPVPVSAPAPDPAPVPGPVPTDPTPTDPAPPTTDDRPNLQPESPPPAQRLAPLPDGLDRVGFEDVVSTVSSTGRADPPTVTGGADGGGPASPVVFLAAGVEFAPDALPLSAEAAAPGAAPAPDTKPSTPETPVAVSPPVPPVSPVSVGVPTAVVPVPPPESPDPDAAAEAVSTGLDKVTNDIAGDVEERAVTDAVVTTAVVATAGYVLLNTRAVSWFISALLARPAVWRRFDPIDVIYSWEREQELGTAAEAEDEADESLQPVLG